MSTPLVIVGSGMGGYGLLRALRHLDRARPVVLLTADEGAAYAKSQLAGSLGRGKSAGDLVLATAEQMAHRLDATVRTHTRLLAIDRARSRIHTDRGELPYAQLVLALGAEEIKPARVRGSGARRILTLGSLSDYRDLRNELAGQRRVVVLGGGRRGCEFAENLARAGWEATLLETGSRLFPEHLPALCAARVAQGLRAAGVRVLLEDGAQRIERDGDGVEITTLGGQRLKAELVVAALGARPRAEIARSAGLAVGRGIVVDPQLRTSDPAIFALGECAELGGRVFTLAEDIDGAAHVLAAVLAGKPDRMRWLARLQRPQLEGCPVVLCEPPPIAGEWQERANPRGVRALFHDRHGALRGFALVGEPVAEAARLFGLVRR